MTWGPQKNNNHRREALKVNRKWDLSGKKVSVGGERVYWRSLERDYCEKESLIPPSEQVLRAENCQWQRYGVWLTNLIGVKKNSWVFFHIRKNYMSRFSPRQLRNNCCLGEFQAVDEQGKRMTEISYSERRISKTSQVTGGSVLEQSIINLFTECFATQSTCALRTVAEDTLSEACSIWCRIEDSPYMAWKSWRKINRQWNDNEWYQRWRSWTWGLAQKILL